jgi:hypothetical protein
MLDDCARARVRLVAALDVAVEQHVLPRTWTSSNTTTASISSKREPSGWSKRERP